MMRFKTLGKSGLEVSVIGLGTWPLGGGYDWGDVSESQAIDTVCTALDHGINLLDTAPVYGNGASENLLGRVLKNKRHEVILATKCGLVKQGSWTVHDLNPTSIRVQLEDSLSRLHTDYIDLYLIHYPDPKVPLVDAVGELAQLKQTGKIRAIGLCNVSASQISQVAQETEIACVQNEYSLLHPQGGASVLEVCQKHGISFMGYGTLGGGLLSAKYTREPNLRRADARNYFYKVARGAAFQKAQQIAQRVKEVAKRHDCAPTVVAAAWALQRADVVLCGAKKPQQVQQNVAVGAWMLPPEEVSFLEQACERD